MNQDRVKEQLDLIAGDKEFKVIFSGKVSKKHHGVYLPEGQEIIIHNRNFTEENEVMSTAIHELAHHEEYTKYGKTGHGKMFKEIYRKLVLAAREKGILEGCKNTEIMECRDQSIEHTRALKEMGRKLLRLKESIKGKYDFEEAIQIDLGIEPSEALSMMKMFAMDISEEIPGDLARKITKIEDPKERREAEQEKYIPAKPPKDQEEEVFLEQERKRLERTLEKIQNRLEEVNLLLEGLNGN